MPLSNIEVCLPVFVTSFVLCVHVVLGALQAPGTAGLVRSRVVKNRRGYWRIRHFQPTDLTAVADLQASPLNTSEVLGTSNVLVDP